MSAVHQLAHLFLRDPSVHRWPEIEASRRDQAIAACGAGCDHLEGEELVAVIDETKRADVFVGAVITSRRYAWRNMSGRGEIHWSDLSHVVVERDPLTSTPWCTRFDGSTVRVPCTSASTCAFFEAVVRLRGEERAVSIHPLPAGRTKARRVLLSRAREHGRGQHRGAWLSSSAPNELARGFAMLFGPPVSSGASGEHYVCDFALSSSWQRIGAIDASPRHDLVHRGGYARRIERLRVVVTPIWPGSTFGVHGIIDGEPAAPLSMQNPTLLAAASSELLRVEGRMFATVPPSRTSAPAITG